MYNFTHLYAFVHNDI